MNELSVFKTIRRVGLWSMFGIVSLVIGMNSYFQTDAGYNYVYQNNLTGTLTVYTEPGIHLRVPFFSKVEEYKQVTTITFDDAPDGSATTRNLSPVEVRFADTYTGTVNTSFRFKMNPEPAKIIALQVQDESRACKDHCFA